MDCYHENLVEKRIEYLTLNSKFIYTGLECSDCGATLWNSDTDRKFNSWLEKLYKSDREKFQIQFGLSKNTISCIKKISEPFPGVGISALFKAIVAIYLELGPNTTFQKIINKVIEGEVYRSFRVRGKDRFKIQFKPMPLMEINSMAEFFDETPAQFVEEGILIILSIFVENDQKLKDFWEENIKNKLNALLKVA
ncbi:MAG: hypothetical protein DRQ89_13530 [Epsilonproteobacteria bacterium]|nr:MAG: hypothetical protein DRQ89_13530 [Campylobacterota bacterium]